MYPLRAFGYNTSPCETTGLTPFKAVFGVEEFKACSELDIDTEED